MMNLSDTIKLFYEGEVTSDTIRLVLNTDMNDIVEAAEEIGDNHGVCSRGISRMRVARSGGISR